MKRRSYTHTNRKAHSWPYGIEWRRWGIYPYMNEAGRLVFAVHREVAHYAHGGEVIDEHTGKQLKRCLQEWHNTPDNKKPLGARKLLYGLHVLLKEIANGEKIYIVEGEPKADYLRKLKFAATTAPEGAGKWYPEHAELLRGAKRVVILPDNDDPGRAHADKVGRSLVAMVPDVRLLELPDLPEHGDVIDWANALDAANVGETPERKHELILEQLGDLAKNARPWKPYGATAAVDNSPNRSFTAAEFLKRDLPQADFLLGNLLSTTSRVLLFADTGIGKTTFGLALTMAAAHGNGFLLWPGVRPASVLYIDAEMSAELMQERLRDECGRLGAIPETFHVLSREDCEAMGPLNTPEGKQFIERETERIGGVNFIVFDNIMTLIAGDQKEEEGWRQTWPWVLSLTHRRIGQLWIHHTGHDTSHSYGTKTREWQMTGTMRLEKVERPDADVSFLLTYPKPSRHRNPTNRAQFEEVRIALVDGQWVYSRASGSSKDKVAPKTAKFFEALRIATTHNEISKDIFGNVTHHDRPIMMHGCPAATIEQWQKECVNLGLLEQSDGKFGNAARSLFSRAKLELISANWIACNQTHAWIV